MTAQTSIIRAVLTALKDDIADEASWAALADLARDEGEPWPDCFEPGHINQRLEAVHRMCLLVAGGEKKDRIENVQYHHRGYKERGYNDPKSGVIAVANWNSVGDDDAIELLGDLLERLDVGVEWEDEWDNCDKCYGLVRTEPDSWGWQPSYLVGHEEYDVLCLGCADKLDLVPFQEDT
jgi:hypothetical protein